MVNLTVYQPEAVPLITYQLPNVCDVQLTNCDPLRKPSMIPATKAAQFRLPGEVTRLYHIPPLAGYDKTLSGIFNKLSDTISL